MYLTKDIRNVAIIAHVDHGKTTLVDELLKQSGAFRKNQVVAERVMDSNDLERERGITILSKNTSIFYNDYKINIVDTPGHADFGGEVERVLKMVDGVVLVVDAFEGPMPQTKFVLKHALELDLSIVVCINKTDRPEARPKEVEDEVLELFMDLEAADHQLDSVVLYASAKKGFAITHLDEQRHDMTPLFEAIVNNIPAPEGSADAPLQMLISTLDYSEYLGRIGIGKVQNGTVRMNEEVVIVNMHYPGEQRRVRVTNLSTFEGLNRVPDTEAQAGEIVALTGLSTASVDLRIGDTIAAIDYPEALPFVKISEPTITMDFSVNNSPLAGQEGKFLTSRHLRERLFRELKTDVSLRVEETDDTDTFKVSGRGELHLSILIETMRREGFEFQVSRPTPIFRDIDGVIHEPFEQLTIDVPEEFVGAVIEKLGKRKGTLENLQAFGSNSRLSMRIPSRGLIGYRSTFLTDTKGSGVLNSLFDDYSPYQGEIPTRVQGSLVAFEGGDTTPYGLYNASERGTLIVPTGVRVYTGQVVGIHARPGDMDINVCKKKQLTNMRSSGADDSLKLPPPTIFSLEQAIEFLNEDELVEITPENLRIRKKVLDAQVRQRQKKNSMS